MESHPRQGDFDVYLDRLHDQLRMGRDMRRRIEAELRDHVEERVGELTADGMSHEKAVALALAEFGDAATLAADFSKVQHGIRRSQIMRVCTVSTAIAAILFFAFSWLHPNGPALTATTPGGEQANAQSPEAPAPSIATAGVVQVNKDERNEKTRRILLETEISVAFVPEGGLDRSLDGIMERCEGVDWIAETDLPDSEDQSALFLNNVPAEMALRRMLAQFDLGYYLDNGVVIVTDRETAAAHLEVRVYDIAALIRDIPGIEAYWEQMILVEAIEDSSDHSPEHLEQVRATAKIQAIEYGAEQVKQLIQESIAPDSWREVRPMNGDKPLGVGSITSYQTALVVRQTEAVHQELEEFLSAVQSVVTKKPDGFDPTYQNLTSTTFTVPIRGSFTINGEPLADTTLLFWDESNEYLATPGATDENGHFEGRIPVGRYEVLPWRAIPGEPLPDARTIDWMKGYSRDLPFGAVATVGVDADANDFEWDYGFDPCSNRRVSTSFNISTVAESEHGGPGPITLYAHGVRGPGRSLYNERLGPADSGGALSDELRPGRYRIAVGPPSFGSGNWSDLPEKYFSPDTSGLEIEVVEGEENAFTFDLELDAPEETPPVTEAPAPTEIDVQGVVTINGEPAEGVTVTFRQSGLRTHFREALTTDAEGRYQAALKPGSYTVTLAKDGLILIPGKDLRTEAHEKVRADRENRFDYDVSAHPIRGKITINGEPAADVRIGLAEQGPFGGGYGSPEYLCETDENGELSGLAPIGPYRVTLSAHDRWEDEEGPPSWLAAFSHEGPEITIEEGENTIDVDIPSISFVGSLTLDNKPIANAYVQFSDGLMPSAKPDPGNPFGGYDAESVRRIHTDRVRTDENGEFRHQLPPGKFFLSVEAPDLPSGWIPERYWKPENSGLRMELNPDDNVGFDIQLRLKDEPTLIKRDVKPTYPVKGTVTLDGAPAADVVIVFTKDRKSQTAIVGQDGGYELELPPGEWTVACRSTVRHDGTRVDIPERYSEGETEIRMDVRSGENTFDLELRSE